MSNLNNFTDDEQLLLILVCNQEALMNKVVELTDADYHEVEMTLGLATGEYLQSLTYEETRELLDTHRANSLIAKALANKHSRSQQ